MSLDTLEPSAADEAALDFVPTPCAKKYRVERDKRLRPDANAQYVGDQGRLRPLYRRPLCRAGVHPRAADRRGGRADHRRRLRRADGRGAPGEAGPERNPHRRKRPATSGRAPGTGTLSRRPSATSKATSTCRSWKRPATSRRRSTATPPRSAPTPGASARPSISTGSPAFQTEILRLRWLEAEKRWLVRHQSRRCDQGPLRGHVQRAVEPAKLPGIPGIETFKGHSFHTSRWDYAYTGGDSAGNLTGLADKRVAIIGTGATPIQSVPTSAVRPSTSTSFSARHRRSICAATGRPTRTGPPR